MKVRNLLLPMQSQSRMSCCNTLNCLTYVGCPCTCTSGVLERHVVVLNLYIVSVGIAWTLDNGNENQFCSISIKLSNFIRQLALSKHYKIESFPFRRQMSKVFS